ncbi:MAG TPA: class I SAM-dependent methyltransferase, partial [Rhizomicrobium sp.]|nr:class I SAM-dependent methyltransferase [Rhizomicrobium sp.]
MSLIAMAGRLAEQAPLPDAVLALGMRHLVAKQARLRTVSDQAADEQFAIQMEAFPVADHPDQANAQHYEVPAEFFAHALGARRKYSSCLYPKGTESLNEAEAIALLETCAHAQLRDGQDVLELGCGWGSLSLWMAERYPHSRITSVSNSASQREYIESEARKRGFTNLRVITADMNEFQAPAKFDRIVSVEMFEHMANWRALLSRVNGWLKD